MEDKKNWIEYRGLKFLHIIGNKQRMEYRKGDIVYYNGGSLSLDHLILCEMLIKKYDLLA